MSRARRTPIFVRGHSGHGHGPRRSAGQSWMSWIPSRQYGGSIRLTYVASIEAEPHAHEAGGSLELVAFGTVTVSSCHVAERPPDQDHRVSHRQPGIPCKSRIPCVHATRSGKPIVGTLPERASPTSAPGSAARPPPPPAGRHRAATAAPGSPPRGARRSEQPRARRDRRLTPGAWWAEGRASVIPRTCARIRD